MPVLTTVTTLAGSTCIGDGSLAAGVAGLVADATAGWVDAGWEGAETDGMTMREGGEKDWGGS